MAITSFDAANLSTPEIHGLMLGGVSPRPIALASTVDKDGNVNLAPYSFFNAFSANPPIMIFSSARSGRTGKTKDTYKNIKEVAEVCINIVEADMVHQISFASSEFPRGVNEFPKSGLTEVKSENIQPPRVAESPISYECKVNEVIELGQEGGAGNLFICQVVKVHVADRILNEEKKIDPLKIHQAARCGGPYYLNSDPERMYPISHPLANLGMGVDGLKEEVRNSKVLTGNNLGQLALNQTLPAEEEISDFKSTETFKYLMGFEGDERLNQFHKAASEMLGNNNNRMALICLYSI